MNFPENFSKVLTAEKTVCFHLFTYPESRGHSLLFFLIPGPQVLEHEDHSPQAVHWGHSIYIKIIDI